MRASLRCLRRGALGGGCGWCERGDGMCYSWADDVHYTTLPLQHYTTTPDEFTCTHLLILFTITTTPTTPHTEAHQPSHHHQRPDSSVPRQVLLAILTLEMSWDVRDQTRPDETNTRDVMGRDETKPFPRRRIQQRGSLARKQSQPGAMDPLPPFPSSRIPPASADASVV